MHLHDTRSRAPQTVVLAMACTAGVCCLVAAAAPPEPAIRWADSRSAIVALDRTALEQQAASGAPFRVASFPLAAGRTVDLELQRFRITTPQTRFVLGRLGQADVPLDFDPDSVLLLRGHVPGAPGSLVFLGLSDWVSNGYIDLGPGRERYWLASRATGGASLPPGEYMVFESRGGGLPSEVPLCGVSATGLPPEQQVPGQEEGVWTGGAEPIRGLQQIELAVETDYELFELFGNANATNAYVLQLYAADSVIYIREVNAYFTVTFVRIWDNPNDLFNEPDPFGPFRNYWNANMGNVRRDVAQFFSGRRNLPYGGVANVSVLCNLSSAYSVAGYALGYFASTERPDVENRDIVVTAHELGHNCGTLHTHDYNLDDCDNVNTPPRRGTIMSYCSQTVPGGDAVTDLRFETSIQTRMKNHINSVACVADDCNRNGVPDAQDISGGFSQDRNANGIPDECEDCNRNGRLDPDDIRGGFSRDLNTNGVPDECEPDCNRNQVPDEMDIRLGTSQDRYQDGVPDECERDCDASGGSDYNQIQADMSLDINRNVILDRCEDCDGDGTPDLTELEGAWDVYVASLAAENAVREFHSITGVLVRVGSTNAVNQGHDLIVLPDERILVTSAGDNRVVELNRLGQPVRDFVPPGSGGLSFPTFLTRGPNGNIFVSSRNNHSVLEYHGTTGAFVRVFVASGAGGLTQPYGLTFGPSGNLYVASSDNQVLEFDGSSGAFVRVFVSAAGNGGLNTPRGLLFKPTDGNLLVCSYGTDSLLEYNGQTGAFIRRWNRNGDGVALLLDAPWGIRIGPDGQVYASRHQVPTDLHINRTRIYKFDIRNGNFLHNYVNGHATGLWFATGFDFMPGTRTDCNRNQLPDTCDVASGFSADENRNGRPDECETCRGDIDVDGSVGQSDLGILLSAWGSRRGDPNYRRGADLDNDGDVDQADLGILLGVWGRQC